MNLEEERETALEKLFAQDELPSEADEARVRMIMSRVQQDSVTKDLLLFSLMRVWLSLVEFGANMYAGRSHLQTSVLQGLNGRIS